MSGRKSTSKSQRDAQLYQVQRLYFSGYRQIEVAEELGISQQQVSYDLKILRKRWIKETQFNFDEALAEQLLRIDKMEREAWEAWEQSKSEFVRTKQEKTKSGDDKASVQKELRCGDPRYLTTVQWCINKRCELLGLNAPLKSEIQSGPLEIKIVYDDGNSTS